MYSTVESWHMEKVHLVHEKVLSDILICFFISVSQWSKLYKQENNVKI